MPTQIGYETSAHMYNRHLLFNIGHFNDKLRETIKGATFDVKQKGYALGSNAHLDDIKNLLLGSTLNKFLFRYASQSINYVECHDNNTFFDKASIALGDATVEEVKKRQRLATAFVILAQGVPFIHAGQEFFRTKKGVENSYKSPDSINEINWNLLDENKEHIDFVKELIRIRKKYDLFRLSAPSQIKECIDVRINDNGTIIYKLKDQETDLIVIFKNSFIEEEIEFDDKYSLIFDGNTRSRRVITKLKINDVTTYILKRK